MQHEMMDREKIKKLSELSMILLNLVSLDEGVQKASELIKEIIAVDRVSIFIHDKEKELVWTYVADGIDKLLFPSNKGIVGYVIEYKTIKVVNDTSKESNFYTHIDSVTGYKTENLLALPIFDRKGEVLGVIELINKVDGKFTPKELNLANLFTNYIAPPLECLIYQ